MVDPPWYGTNQGTRLLTPWTLVSLNTCWMGGPVYLPWTRTGAPGCAITYYGPCLRWPSSSPPLAPDLCSASGHTAWRLAMIEFVQLNLHKASHATVLLSQTMEGKSNSVYLLTEPHTIKGRITGLPRGTTVVYDRSKQSSTCLLYTSPSPRDRQKSRMPSSA